MIILVDTNVLLRLSDRSHRQHSIASTAVRNLASTGHAFCIGTQTVSEFLAVATRPVSANGLGLDHRVADNNLSLLTVDVKTFYDSAAIIARLRFLVTTYAITGKKVHDAKLAATMQINGIAAILTFNARDFVGLPGIDILDPNLIGAGPPENEPAAPRPA